MTQEEQTALVDGQQASAAATDAAKKVDDEPANKTVADELIDAAVDKATGQEGQAQMRAIFKQLIRMRSVRKLSPAAKASKAARQAARAAQEAAKAAEVAAKAADSAAKAAQEAAKAALEESNKAEAEKKQAEEAASKTETEPPKPAAEVVAS